MFRQVRAAQHIVEASRASPSRLSLVLSQKVSEEWERNIENVAAQAVEWTVELCNGLSKLQELSRLLGSGLIVPPNPVDHSSTISILTALAQNVRDAGTVLDSDVRCERLAFERCIQGIPPAGQGECLGDCIILEHYLELCRQLRSKAFNGACVFATSNTKDYCGKMRELHPDLVEQFRPIKLKWAGDLAWALHECGCPM